MEPATPYILDNRGNRIYEETEKEEKYREIWSNVFRISDEENTNFDQQQERIVERYLQRHNFRFAPYERADLDRLNETNYLIRYSRKTKWGI